MPIHTFNEITTYLAKQLKVNPPPNPEQEALEIYLDNLVITIRPNQIIRGLTFEISLGILLHPISHKNLKELLASNFLGINTGGCTLCYKEDSSSLLLKTMTTPYTTPTETLNWLYRSLGVATEWMKVLELWEGFVPLMPHIEEPSHERLGERA